MCIYIHIYIYTYVYVYIYIYIYTSVAILAQACSARLERANWCRVGQLAHPPLSRARRFPSTRGQGTSLCVCGPSWLCWQHNGSLGEAAGRMEVGWTPQWGAKQPRYREERQVPGLRHLQEVEVGRQDMGWICMSLWDPHGTGAAMAAATSNKHRSRWWQQIRARRRRQSRAKEPGQAKGGFQ